MTLAPAVAVPVRTAGTARPELARGRTEPALRLRGARDLPRPHPAALVQRAAARTSGVVGHLVVVPSTARLPAVAGCLLRPAAPVVVRVARLHAAPVARRVVAAVLPAPRDVLRAHPCVPSIASIVHPAPDCNRRSATHPMASERTRRAAHRGHTTRGPADRHARGGACPRRAGLFATSCRGARGAPPGYSSSDARASRPSSLRCARSCCTT